MKSFFTFIFLFLIVLSYSQNKLLSNLITGSDPGATNPYSSGQTINVNFTSDGIRRGSGLSAFNGNDRFNALNWTTAQVLEASDYFEWTITPNANVVDLDFMNLNITLQRSATGPNNFELRSSLDSYSNSLFTQNGFASGGGSAGFTINLSSIQNINTAITFRLYGYSAGTATGTMSVNDYSFTYQGLVLPVKISKFEVSSYYDKALIEWVTNSEINNDYFSIEHSVDGRHFKEIHREKGQLESKEEIRYEYLHDGATETNFYRLSQKDIDGKYEELGIRELNLSKRKSINIYPTYTQGIFMVEKLDLDDNLQLYDTNGRRILETKETIVDISNIQNGLYIALISGKAFKIVKE
jgi:hypothetical protein